MRGAGIDDLGRAFRPRGSVTSRAIVRRNNAGASFSKNPCGPKNPGKSPGHWHEMVPSQSWNRRRQSVRRRLSLKQTDAEVEPDRGRDRARDRFDNPQGSRHAQARIAKDIDPAKFDARVDSRRVSSDPNSREQTRDRAEIDEEFGEAHSSPESQVPNAVPAALPTMPPWVA